VVLSFVLLFILTAFSAAAAVAVTMRAPMSGRAEHLVAATATWNLLILAPIFGLGWMHRLDAWNLGWVSSGISGATLVLSAHGRPWREHAGDLGRAVRGLLRLPVDAVLLAYRPVSSILVVVLGTGGLILWSAISAYYSHPWRMWDCLWYHEPIIAFTIQYRGFQLLSLPDSLQRINSLPRVGEMTDLWFVIFTDRRLIDITSSLLSPAIVASEYLLCARFAKNRVVALGWACAFFLMPSIVWELGTSLVDVHVAFLLLAALWFACRPRAGLAHSILAAVALTLAVGTKYQSLVPVFSIAPIVLVRTWLVRGARILAKAAITLLGSAAIVGFAATTYLRNYLVFHNPFWPFLIPSHPDWPGQLERGQDLTKGNLDINIPYDEALKALFAAGEASMNYGLGFAWVILPLFACAVLAFGVQVLACLLRRGRSRRAAPGTDWRSLLLVAVTCLPALAVVWTSPALNQGRYHMFVVGSMVALIAWMTGASRIGGIAGEGAVGAACVIMVMNFFDADPMYIFSYRQMHALLRIPFPEREVTPELGSAVYRDIGLAREEELGPGDLVVFGDDYGGFPSEFFNNRFSNRAIYVPESGNFVQDAQALGAKWIFCDDISTCARRLAAPNSGWQSLGELHILVPGQIFHRVPP
jgi:hypothetical protein